MQDDERVAWIEDVIQPVVRDHGLTLVDLEWRARRPRGVLRVYVDKPGGVSLAECERLSREVGDVLDVAGRIAYGYDLEVSSPGLDRLLRKDREYQWAIGRPVRCWLADGRLVRGRLSEVSGGQIVLEGDAGRLELERARVTKARLDADVPWPRQG